MVDITPKISKAIDVANVYHKGQKRRSGAPYLVHPLCVAAVVGFYGGDEAMVCSAILHDAVEDTFCSIENINDEFGEEVSIIVDALTKIVEIRNENIPLGAKDKKLVSSALSFRKVLLASICDVRALFIKICDRLHNVLTLEHLPLEKRVRISEETLLVYAPIAHRLGISSIKNELEDKSFLHIFPQEYEKIDSYINENKQDMGLKLNTFVDRINSLLLCNGFLDGSFQIQSRIKRNYSIYLKMQRKGINIDEILDLLAIRVLVKTPTDCYKVLGIIHTNLTPIISRFKDYIAIPKENGYRTIHTSVFDDASIFEVQIRTFDMHKSAEYGLAAHWKYKIGHLSPSLDWLSKLEYKNDNIEEFYELVKNDLYREDVLVFSPAGDVYSLPSGAVVLDFAYLIHSELGESAKEAFVNNQKVSLLHRLKNGDIVKIIGGGNNLPKYTWIDLVKTSKAKHHIKNSYQNRIKEVNKQISLCIYATLFSKKLNQINKYVLKNDLDSVIHKSVLDLEFLKDLFIKMKKYFINRSGIIDRIKISMMKLKTIKIDNFSVYTNKNITEALFEYCCYPKYGDEIVAINNAQKIFVHHKLCDNAKTQMANGANVVFVEWIKNIDSRFKIIATIDDTKGSLARFLLDLAKYNCNVTSAFFNGQHMQNKVYFEVCVQIPTKSVKGFKSFLTNKYKIVEFHNIKDAYQN